MKPTPHNLRLKKYRHELEKSGGHRLLVDIEAPAHDALNTIMEFDTPSNPEKTKLTQKEATTNALLHYAKVVNRRRG